MISVTKKVFCILSALFLTFTFSINISSNAYASSSEEIINPYESSSVIEDLEGNLWGFLKDYFNEGSLSNNSVPSIDGKLDNFSVIAFLEYGYGTSEVAFYIYVYNPYPNKMAIDNRTLKNEISMAMTSDDKKNLDEQDIINEYKLKLINMSDNGHFSKYKILGVTPLSSSSRYYWLNGITLNVPYYNSLKPTEFNVGAVYCNEQEVVDGKMSTKISRKANTTISLDVEHTYYRSEFNGLGPGYASQISSCYFSIPKSFSFNGDTLTGGDITSVLAEFSRYFTRPMLVLNDYGFYNKFYDMLRVPVNDKENFDDIHYISSYIDFRGADYDKKLYALMDVFQSDSIWEPGFDNNSWDGHNIFGEFALNYYDGENELGYDYIEDFYPYSFDNNYFFWLDDDFILHHELVTQDWLFYDPSLTFNEDSYEDYRLSSKRISDFYYTALKERWYGSTSRIADQGGESIETITKNRMFVKEGIYDKYFGIYDNENINYGYNKIKYSVGGKSQSSSNIDNETIVVDSIGLNYGETSTSCGFNVVDNFTYTVYTKELPPIVKVDYDFVSLFNEPAANKETLCKVYYIDKTEIDEFISYCNTHKNEDIYIFRYDSCPYYGDLTYCFEGDIKTQRAFSNLVEEYVNNNYQSDTFCYGLLASEMVYFDFDFLSFDYTQDGKTVTVPVVYSPEDHFNEIGPAPGGEKPEQLSNCGDSFKLMGVFLLLVGIVVAYFFISSYAKKFTGGNKSG